MMRELELDITGMVGFSKRFTIIQHNIQNIIVEKDCAGDSEGNKVKSGDMLIALNGDIIQPIVFGSDLVTVAEIEKNIFYSLERLPTTTLKVRRHDNPLQVLLDVILTQQRTIARFEELHKKEKDSLLIGIKELKGEKERLEQRIQKYGKVRQDLTKVLHDFTRIDIQDIQDQQPGPREHPSQQAVVAGQQAAQIPSRTTTATPAAGGGFSFGPAQQLQQAATTTRAPVFGPGAPASNNTTSRAPVFGPRAPASNTTTAQQIAPSQQATTRAQQATVPIAPLPSQQAPAFVGLWAKYANQSQPLFGQSGTIGATTGNRSTEPTTGNTETNTETNTEPTTEATGNTNTGQTGNSNTIDLPGATAPSSAQQSQPMTGTTSMEPTNTETNTETNAETNTEPTRKIENKLHCQNAVDSCREIYDEFFGKGQFLDEPVPGGLAVKEDHLDPKKKRIVSNMRRISLVIQQRIDNGETLQDIVNEIDTLVRTEREKNPRNKKGEKIPVSYYFKIFEDKKYIE